MELSVLNKEKWAEYQKLLDERAKKSASGSLN